MATTVAALAAASIMALAPLTATAEETQKFVSAMLEDVAKTATAEKKFEVQKAGICALADELKRTGNVSTANTAAAKNKDATHRPVYVNFQAIFEFLLANRIASGEVASVAAVIHTPTPCTPLCTKGEISDKLVHDSMKADPHRTATVTERAVTLRNFLDAGCHLYVVYTDKKGRTPEQLAIYAAECTKERPLHNLHDCPLTKKPLPAEMCGATYLITLKNKDQVLFSIKAKQANNPTEDDFEIWVAPKTDAKAVERLTAVNTMLVECGGPDVFIEQPKK